MPRQYRREVLLVLVLVALTAGYVRWIYIPSFHDRHVDVSEAKYDYDVGEPGPWFSAWSLGDGQAYALIAIDPTGRKLAEEIPEAGYRFSRAGFGWLAWTASLGRSDFVPYAMALIGLLSVAGIVAVAVRLRPRLGPKTWLIILNPAIFIGFAGDTSEPLGIMLLAIALGWGSRVAGALLGVARPSFLVALWGRWRLLLSGVAGAALLGVYGVAVFGLDAMVPSGGRLGLPFVAYVDNPSVWGLILAFCAAATLVIGALRRDWSWVVVGVFVLCLGSDVLRDPVNAWRASGFLSVIWAFGPNYRIGTHVAQSLPAAADVV